MAPPKPPLGPSSSFQVLQKTTYGEAGGTSISPSEAPTENKVENPSSTNKVSAAVIVYSADKSEMGLNLDPDIADPRKLRRIMSNRLSAQRSRLKKMKYLSSLEILARTYEAQIAELEPQLSTYENKKEFLTLEHQTLEHQMAVLQKETFLRDAEIKKNKAEVNVLRKIHARQLEQLKIHMLTMNTSLLEPVPNGSISSYYTNSYQGNGGETLYMEENDIASEQGQMWINKANMHETNNISVPNSTQSMEPNHINETVPNYISHHFT